LKRVALLSLVLLLASAAHSAVTQLGSTTIGSHSANASSQTLSSHVVTSGTDLLIVCEGHRSNQTTTGVDFNTSEALTLIADNAAAIVDQNDPYISVWGIVSPTATTADIVATYSGGTVSWGFIAATNYDGVDNASVAAATNSLEEITETTGGSTTAFSSAGSAGNALAVCASMIGGNGDPVSNNASFAELAEGDTGALTGNGDATYYNIHLLDSAPSAVTITWNKSDEHAGEYFEIVAAGVGSTTAVQRRRHDE